MVLGIWRNLRLVIADAVIFFLGFLFGIVVNRSVPLSGLFSLYFLLQLALWMVVSALFMKYSTARQKGITLLAGILFLCNTLIFLAGTYGFNLFIPVNHPAKRFYFYTVAFSTVLEFIFFSFYQSYLAARKRVLWESEEVSAPADTGWPEIATGHPVPVKGELSTGELSQQAKALIIQEIGQPAFDRLSGWLTTHHQPLLLVSTITRFNILSQPMDAYGTIVNLAGINGIRYLNKFFEAVNAKLQPNGLFIGRAEVYSTRKKRFLRYYPYGINYLIYSFDYLINRVFPKLLFTKQIYFLLTRGHSRVLSRTETLGRLYSCGFEVAEEIEMDDLLYFIGRKIRAPFFDNNPTYGALIKLNRVGKDGRIIGIYKLRTMHPYSEYLQPYIYDKHRLNPAGKISNDFRVTTIGAVARKFWIDELPMVINLIKGDVKLVGVRPLSKHFFGLYTPELQTERIKYKPGLVPPYYADMPRSLEEVMASEMRYLERYRKHPIRTDIHYFWMAIWHIVFKRARSS